VDTDRNHVINNVEPLWTRKPAELKDEDYQKFYKELYPMADDPLFHIHLNVDYPFHLTGILYFPKIKDKLELSRNKIQLFCNQMYVTDSVENIVPEFLTLLHGVIDSPDIPLNVSRSYLQSDANVKKISSYITKKVNDRLASIFKNEREDFEKKWDDIKIFIHYGLLTEEDYFDKAKAYFLLKDTEGKHYTLDEYHQFMLRIQARLAPRRVSFFISSNEDFDPTLFTGCRCHRFGREPSGAILDLHTLSLCDRIAGPWSTFSRWASFIGEVPLCCIKTSDQQFADDEFARITDFYHFETGESTVDYWLKGN
jgi:hypothetical protein